VVKLILASVAPPVVEKVGAKHIQNTIDKAPPAGDTPGAVLEPVMEGTEVRRGNKGGRSDAREDPMTSDRPQRNGPGNR
jgi:hypothetical protein